MDRVKTIDDSDWRDGFLFVGNQLALDFVNTCPVQNGRPMELIPDFSALLRWFQAAKLLSAREAAPLLHQWGHSARARRTVEAVRELVQHAAVWKPHQGRSLCISPTHARSQMTR